MPTPEFYHFIRPMLEIVREHPGISFRPAADLCASRLKLSESDKSESVPSGQPKWLNRSQWALTYLRQAVLIQSIERGSNKITDRGIEYLSRAPLTIKPNDLMEFPEFAEFNKGKKGTRKTGAKAEQPILASEETPHEAMAQAYATQRSELADNLLDHLRKVSPSRFEQLIVDLMLALGYGGPREDAGQALGRIGDGGVDGIIRQDRLGLDNIYLQAKRYTDNTVGTGEVNGFIGALTTRGANKGVLITTSSFSESAKKVAASAPHLKLSLIDGKELANLMIDANLGVATEFTYMIKRIDSDYFDESF